MTEEHKLILELLNHLPDSMEQEGEDWNQSWDALTLQSQEKVAAIRDKATKFLEEKGIKFEEQT